MVVSGPGFVTVRVSDPGGQAPHQAAGGGGEGVRGGVGLCPAGENVGLLAGQVDGDILIRIGGSAIGIPGNTQRMGMEGIGADAESGTGAQNPAAGTKLEAEMKKIPQQETNLKTCWGI